MPLTRRLILQKARHHPHTPQRGTQALTDCRQTVSGTISLPSRGTFHLSLTVLVRYRSPGSIQAYQVVLADSRQITGVRRYSGMRVIQAGNFHLPDYHRLRCRLPTTSASPRLYHCPTPCQMSTHAPHKPAHATPDRYHTRTV